MKSLLILFAAILPFSSKAQELSSVTGIIVNVDQQPIAAGDVYLLKISDSSIVQHSSIINGSFTFKASLKTEYILKVSSQGYKTWQQLFKLSSLTPVSIQLEYAAAVLNEVTVTGAMKQIAVVDGNMVMNIQNTPLASISDAVTLLSKFPTVMISSDGESISVVGKGEPLIYIDNEKMTMNDLRSLSVADIATIQLINNPSSRYEANGRAVILIARKKNLRQGTKGDVTESVAYRRYGLNRFSANVSMRKKKIELKGNIQYNQLKTWEGNDFDFRITNRNILSRYSVTAVTARPQFIGEAGMFYEINNNDYLSVNTSGRTQREDFPINTNSSLETPDHTQHVISATANEQPVNYVTARLNYNHKLHHGNGSLFVGAQHTYFSKDLTNSVRNSVEGQPFSLTQQRRNNANVKVDALRLDFENTYGKSIKVESGVSYTKAASAGNTVITGYNPSSTTKGVYSASEANYAAYSQLGGKLNKVAYTVGVRMEDNLVQSAAQENSTVSSLKKHNTRVFPKAAITVPIDSSSSIKLNYSQSVQRQNYTNALQTSVYINPYFEWVNNPNLNASYTQDLSTTMTYKEFSLAVGLTQTTGPVYNELKYDDQAAHLTRTERNYDNEHGFYIQAIIPVRTKAWTATNVIYFVSNKATDRSADITDPKPFLYATSSNDFKLPLGFTFSLSGWFITRSSQGVVEQNSMFGSDSSLSKTFFKNLTCTMRFTDMFASVNAREKFNVSGVAASGLYHDNGRELALSLRYAFGKLKESRFTNKEVDENVKRVN